MKSTRGAGLIGDEALYFLPSLSVPTNLPALFYMKSVESLAIKCGLNNNSTKID